MRRAEVGRVVVGCVVGDADFDLWGERLVRNTWRRRREVAYICWDEVAADGRAGRRGDAADAFRYGWEHSHAFFQASG